MTLIYTLVIVTLSSFGFYFIFDSLYWRFKLKDTGDSEPTIFHKAIIKHSRYSDDKAKASEILESYRKFKEYRDALKEYSLSSAIDLKDTIKYVDKMIKTHIHIAEVFEKTQALNQDRAVVSIGLRKLAKKLETVMLKTDTINILNEGINSVNEEALKIYKDNKAKCDIIRPHNHKAVPMKDLNESLMSMLEKLVSKPDVEEQKGEITRQLKDLSTTINNCIESLNTYDSKRFVNNEIMISQRLLDSLKQANYEDTLDIRVK